MRSFATILKWKMEENGNFLLEEQSESQILNSNENLCQWTVGRLMSRQAKMWKINF